MKYAPWPNIYQTSTGNTSPDIDLMEHLAAEGEAIIIPQASWNTEDRYVGKPIINLRDPLASQAEAMKLPDEEEDEAQ